jgi:hypothetical protein
LRVDRFPYWIYYQVSDEYITILTVFHSSRNPVDLERALGTDQPLPAPGDPS